MGKYNCYVVINGRKPGVYRSWEETNAQVKGYPMAKFWGCRFEEEAFKALLGAKEEVRYIPICRSPNKILDNHVRPEVAAKTVALPPHTVGTLAPTKAVGFDLQKTLTVILLVLLIAIAIKLLVKL
ncbi:ribonuclease H [Ranunculus cassubicifolius]